MGLKNYALGGVLLLTIGLVAGCAGPRSVSTVFDGSEELQIVVENETHERMTVFALWRAGPRVRLGQVGGGEDVTFTTPVRGPDVWVGVELLSGSRVTYGQRLILRLDPAGPGETFLCVVRGAHLRAVSRPQSHREERQHSTDPTSRRQEFEVDHVMHPLGAREPDPLHAPESSLPSLQYRQDGQNVLRIEHFPTTSEMAGWNSDAY